MPIAVHPATAGASRGRPAAAVDRDRRDRRLGARATSSAGDVAVAETVRLRAPSSVARRAGRPSTRVLGPSSCRADGVVDSAADLPCALPRRSSSSTWPSPASPTSARYRPTWRRTRRSTASGRYDTLPGPLPGPQRRHGRDQPGPAPPVPALAGTTAVRRRAVGGPEEGVPFYVGAEWRPVPGRQRHAARPGAGGDRRRGPPRARPGRRRPAARSRRAPDGRRSGARRSPLAGDSYTEIEFTVQATVDHLARAGVRVPAGRRRPRRSSARPWRRSSRGLAAGDARSRPASATASRSDLPSTPRRRRSATSMPRW